MKWNESSKDENVFYETGSDQQYFDSKHPNLSFFSCWIEFCNETFTKNEKDFKEKIRESNSR